MGNYSKPTMRVLILILSISSILFSGCLTGDTKCCDNVGTKEISKGLYLERYRTFCAGVFGELTECYLTDSATFRQKIGSYDEHESLSPSRVSAGTRLYVLFLGHLKTCYCTKSSTRDLVGNRS